MLNSKQKTEILKFFKDIKYGPHPEKNWQILEEDRKLFGFGEIWLVCNILTSHGGNLVDDPERDTPRYIATLYSHSKFDKNMLSLFARETTDDKILSQIAKAQLARKEYDQLVYGMLIDFFNGIFDQCIGAHNEP